MATDDWRGPMDRLKAAIGELQQAHVPRKEGEQAARDAEKAERQLWGWRHSVEAAYLQADVARIIGRIALQEQLPPMQVVAQAISEGALVPSWWKLDRYATRYGVPVWPDDASEGAEDGDEPTA